MGSPVPPNKEEYCMNYKTLGKSGVEVSELIGRIDELSMRWLELSEIGE